MSRFRYPINLVEARLEESMRFWDNLETWVEQEKETGIDLAHR
jgi:hypothetical protein